MVFSSLIFLFLFLPLVLLGHWLLPQRWRNGFLLGSSLIFYAWSEQLLVFLLIGSSLMNYTLALLIDRYHGLPTGKTFLRLAIVLNLGLLVTCKYANFFADNLNAVLTRLGLPGHELASIYLPLGISFYTFQALSYVIDVYRRDVPVQRNPFHLTLYKSLFPQLIAGPIVRYKQVAAEIAWRTIQRPMFASGIRRFVIGLSKKVLVANTVAVAADAIFERPGSWSAAVCWFGIICYALQIYFDFSGYSDMAIGMGRMLGFNFNENFNLPYTASSLTDFWRRWHISLSTWFRDYVYIPLGGNRISTVRTYVHLIVVFFLCGLWHGASWNFVAWGLCHGSFLVFERAGLDKRVRGWWRPLQHFYCLSVVLLAWVFFRTHTLGEAFSYFGALFGSAAPAAVAYPLRYYLNRELGLAIIVGVIGAGGGTALIKMAADRWRRAFGASSSSYDIITGSADVFANALLLVFSVLSLAGGTHNPFIYYRF